MSSSSFYVSIDIGNTSIHMGVFEGDQLLREKKLPVHEMLDLDQWWKKNFASQVGGELEGVGLASVNPRITQTVINWVENSLERTARDIGSKVRSMIDLEVDRPQEVGADRLINAYMAFHRYQRGILIVDFGTAVTIDVVSSQGAYQGGVISPGMKLAAKSLMDKTALLPLIQVQPTRKVVGKNTVEAINSGIYWGTVGMVDFLVEKISRELDSPSSLVIGTGGDSHVIAPQCESISRIDPYLTLEGIAFIDRQ